MDIFKKAVENILRKEVSGKIELTIPPNLDMGDYAYPCFEIAKLNSKNPAEMAEKIAKKLRLEKPIIKAEVKGPYINFFVDRSEFSKHTLVKISKEKDKYGSSKIGIDKTIVVDFSSPNIAKPFGIGHLRSTVIGNSIYHLLSFLGYSCVRVNHLGDWGTQFGKLIVAYQKWGEEEKLQKKPIMHLYSLYVKFHEEAKITPELEDEAREWFRKLETGDKKAFELWELFKQLSIEEFKKYYAMLKIEFDYYQGEAFYNTMIDEIIEEAKQKGLTDYSEGALVVPMEKPDTPPLMLRKKDEGTTYAARDIAAAIYRIKKHNPFKIIYVVGTPQKLHFEQLFYVLDKMGYNKDRFSHVDFGHLRFEDKKMSTREGNIIFLEDVLDKAISLAKETIKQKNPELMGRNKVARQVGIGAVIFADLMNDRIRDIVFDWSRILDFEGDTAPYIQYTHTRACSILRKSDIKRVDKIDYALLQQPEEIKMIKAAYNFPEVVLDSAVQFKPSILARYLLDLAHLYNEFYQKCPILKEQTEIKKARLALTACIKQVLKNGLRLMGIEAPTEM